MAIPKKNSRLITVDGVRFRWRFSRRSGYCPCCSVPLKFAVQLAEDPGQVLVVSFTEPSPETGLPGNLPITPRIVAASIREALRRGWDPAQPGSAFMLKVTNEELHTLLGCSASHVLAVSA